MAAYRFLTTWLLEAPHEAVWDAIYDAARWPERPNVLEGRARGELAGAGIWMLAAD